MLADRQTDVMELIFDFRNCFADAPNTCLPKRKDLIILLCIVWFRVLVA